MRGKVRLEEYQGKEFSLYSSFKFIRGLGGPEFVPGCGDNCSQDILFTDDCSLDSSSQALYGMGGRYGPVYRGKRLSLKLMLDCEEVEGYVERRDWFHGGFAQLGKMAVSEQFYIRRK